ncbi:hypothetical protein BT63DRAFT_450633 [Microthyrium microscopicum]|uniref:RING-type E3 ubiquitin transferase n=1 Tax=Microthyrium microscopicum TaxID=703497 RepID=A0A6A6UME0_9PEZI|nr:hypothetical protein BT63DRAFT_450633 [Microthyrium microscopicum]
MVIRLPSQVSILSKSYQASLTSNLENLGLIIGAANTRTTKPFFNDKSPAFSPSRSVSIVGSVGRSFFTLLVALVLCLSSLPSTTAQSISTTTSFSPDQVSANIELVFGSYQSDNTRYLLAPLASTTTSTIQGKLLLGTFIKANASSVNFVNTNEIAFVSCDTSAYADLLGPVNTLIFAVKNDPIAIVLYSNTAKGCAYSPGDKIPSTFAYLFSLTGAQANGSLTSFAAGAGGHVAIATQAIFEMNSSSGSSGGGASGGVGGPGGNAANQGSQPGGPSPSTAVAMIILYSITGVITALFLVIIITGAVRAHRHPERYGPRNTHGRSRQSRAKGLARAMLDTLPIVKFGEKEEEKPADIELAGATANRAATTDQKTTAEEGAEIQDSTKQEGEQSNTDPSKESTTPPIAEDVQGCSICTDDFELGQDVRVLPCNHSFHPTCIDPWLLNVSGTCPLCRIDLRPESEQARDPVNRTATEADIFPPPIDPVEAANRRSSRRQSMMWDLINPSRMRDATPQERIEALRRVREQRRTSPTEEADARRRRRLTARLHDVFSIRTSSRHESPPTMSGSVQPEPRTAITPSRGSPSRRSPSRRSPTRESSPPATIPEHSQAAVAPTTLPAHSANGGTETLTTEPPAASNSEISDPEPPATAPEESIPPAQAAATPPTSSTNPESSSAAHVEPATSTTKPTT